ncbi:MAG: phenylacetate--CoA ligase [Bacteroidetes bacterium]|nr:phenylacetate--CoA ligase [Bacteroidota bacterium]
MRIPDIEFQSVENLRFFQAKRLHETVRSMAERSPYYKNSLRKLVASASFDFTINDLPFTTKEDLQKGNETFLCVAKTEIADWVTTSGTTGHPISFGLTRSDIERLGVNEALSFVRAGIKSGEGIQITTTLDKRFMAGLAYLEGARRLDCPVVRMGPGTAGLQIDSIMRFQPKVLVAVPSFIRQIILHASSHGIDLNSLSVQKVICIGEPVRNKDFSLNALGKEICQSWDLELYSTYASTEMSTAFSECSSFCGGHLNPELGFVEVLDQNNKQVSNGESGEVVFTSFGIKGMPLLRYRTGDITTYHDSRCPCGSCSPRIGPILGRKQQRIKFKGTTLYPTEIINLIHEINSSIPYVIEIEHDSYRNDLLRIRMAIQNEEIPKYKNWFRDNLRVVPQIICDKDEAIKALIIDENKRKPNRVLDMRKLK